MHWVDIFVLLFFVLLVIGGVKDGGVKSFFSLVTTLISVPVAGVSYGIITGWLGFLPGDNWENFFGFFITLAIVSVIVTLLLLIPRKLVKAVWRKGCIFRLAGGALNLFNGCIGLTVFTLVLEAYPFMTWLEKLVSSSAILMWLANSWSFVAAMLPEALRHAPQMLTLIGG